MKQACLFMAVDENKLNKLSLLMTFILLAIGVCNARVFASEWGLGVSFQQSRIPYKNTVSDTVGNTIPSIYYEDDNLFLRGDEWGIKAWTNDRWAINPIARRRWVHLPKAVQNEYQEDAIDAGVQALWQRTENKQWRFELLTESDWKYQLYAGHDWQLRYDRLQLNANAGLRLKSGKYNSYYYGLNDFGGEDINGGVEGILGMDFRYPLIGNFYLTGGLEWTQIDANARQSPHIDKNGYGTVKLGIAFFEQGNDISASIPDDAYLRIAHGWATPSNIGEILRGNGVKDPYNNHMTSVFYGHPLLKGWLLEAMDVYLVAGLVYHAKSSVQDVGWESVLTIKAYYNFAWPVRWRLGIAEGMSYISHLTYIEKNEMDEKGYNPSKLMNALDFSLDANLGDLTTIKALNTAWFGYSLHHRSAIFERASHFGRIKGGSNYNTLYLQWHF